MAHRIDDKQADDVQSKRAKCTNESENWTFVGIRDLLDADTGPSTVLDIDHPNCFTNPCYQNLAFKHVFEQEVDIGEFVPGQSFSEWAASPVMDAERFYRFGYIWTAATIHGRWRFIRGCEYITYDSSQVMEQSLRGSEDTTHELATSSSPTSPIKYADSVSSHQSTVPDLCESGGHGAMTIPPGHDWTLDTPPANASSYILMLRAHDWSSTPYGAMATWPPQLRLMANLLMCDPSPAVLFWGSELAGRLLTRVFEDPPHI